MDLVSRSGCRDRMYDMIRTTDQAVKMWRLGFGWDGHLSTIVFRTIPSQRCKGIRSFVKGLISRNISSRCRSCMGIDAAIIANCIPAERINMNMGGLHYSLGPHEVRQANNLSPTTALRSPRLACVTDARDGGSVLILLDY